MGVHTFLVPCRFLTMLGHFLAALLVFFSYVCRPFPALRVPQPTLLLLRLAAG